MFDELRIDYPGGKVIIIMDAFFPVSRQRITKMYRKVIALSDDPDMIVDRMLEHISLRMEREEKTKKQAANEWMRDKTRLEEAKQQYNDRKEANGAPIRRADLPAKRKQINVLNERQIRDKRVLDMAMREQKKLAQNRATLLMLNGRC